MKPNSQLSDIGRSFISELADHLLSLALEGGELNPIGYTKENIALNAATICVAKLVYSCTKDSQHLEALDLICQQMKDNIEQWKSRRLPAWIWTQAWEYAQPDLYEDEKVPCTEGGMLNLVLFTIYGPVMVQSIDFDFVTETNTSLLGHPNSLISQPS
jgi:hypothetical protein